MMNQDIHITLRPGRKEDAEQIAGLIITAMTEECCMHFCGKGHGMDDFHRLMTRLAADTATQYSYENTICAVVSPPYSDDVNETIAGISVSYDGAQLEELRQPFIDGASAELGSDLSGLLAETQAGELYLDSLAVLPEYRGRGIAMMLLQATAEKARKTAAGPLGLLVDENNPHAERLYNKVGFRVVGTTTWGGHNMKHMQMR